MTKLNKAEENKGQHSHTNKGTDKRTKVLSESSWFCHACKEEQLSDMRQCVQCKK